MLGHKVLRTHIHGSTGARAAQPAVWRAHQRSCACYRRLICSFVGGPIVRHAPARGGVGRFSLTLFPPCSPRSLSTPLVF
eukprot:COSAG06_NODE_37404_length_435_cov_1.238095_1_plen_80_part_00